MIPIADRMRLLDASGIRKVFDLAAKLKDPINLSIGQPDFDVPEPVKAAAIRAVRDGKNRYTPTQGIPELRLRIAADLVREFGRPDPAVLITSGVSGGLNLLAMVLINPGDEVIIPDPYFVMYKHLVNLAGGKPVFVDTYPDFRLRPERVEAAITPRTRLLLLNSPANPTGAIASEADVKAVVEICRRRNVQAVSDEIYDRFCFDAPYASAAKFDPDVLLLRGFSKTYAMTGWRLGYAAGPKPIIEAMTVLQQYSFVCAPAPVQYAGLAALDVDVQSRIDEFRRKRDLMRSRLSKHFRIAGGQGAFYLFPEAPGGSGRAFCEAAVARNVLVIPGGVFSERDTHFRISYAADPACLERGADALCALAEEFGGSRGQ
jgi:aspartate aminotransferase/aminotransferase